MKLRRLTQAGRDLEREQVVLYVEDDDTNWSVAELELRTHYQLKRAKDAQSAFGWLSRQRFDLILMDIELSGSRYDGIEITQLIKGIRAPGANDADYVASCIAHRSTPVIFVTAYSGRYKRHELLQAGGDEVALKPVNFSTLSLAMSRLMLKQAQR